MTTAPIRVLIADDHFVVRRGIGALLTSLDAFVVVGEATTGVEAVREAQLTGPDVVVMDINMPAMNGIESTRQLSRVVPGIAYSADAVANLLAANPAEALEILHGLRGEARDAIAEIRRIVHGLRPRALDELGLVGAVRQQVSRLRTADGRVLDVAFDAALELSELPAAVEVAAYRMAVEAITNVARHSGVAEASVSFTVAEGPVLCVRVEDRGRSTSAWTAGVGIVSMRERVEQVGGTLAVDSGPQGATVTAEIPIPAQAGSVHPDGRPSTSLARTADGE